MSIKEKINYRLLELSMVHLRMMHLHQKGFTLIELLVVIGIVGILLSITLVAINPARQFRLANDAARASHISTLSSAVAQLIIDNKGSLPANLAALSSANYYSLAQSTSTNIAVSVATVTLCNYLTGSISLNPTLGVQTYITKLPADPLTTAYLYTNCNVFDTGYSMKIVKGRVYVAATTQEPAGTIEVSR
jgi:prepilin-type N-terminal cleavage/methylation domain-containing protein